MKSLYLETSALLSWLLGEPSHNKVLRSINEAESILTSALSAIETKRALIRLEHAGQITASQHQRLLGLLLKYIGSWNLMEITEEVQTRASQRFPIEPIRSLDAIHLASALEFLKIFPELRLLSFDQRVLHNAAALGMDIAA
jgi:predicted nucleic acid-binding protein